MCEVVEIRLLGQAMCEAVEIKLLVQQVTERRLSGYQVVEKGAEKINNSIYMSSGIHNIDHKFYTDLMSMDDNKRSIPEKATQYNYLYKYISQDI